MLVDTSVWIDHFRHGNVRLVEHLHGGEVWVHPFVIGEIACGTLERRNEILSLLAALPGAPLVDHGEVLSFVDANRLMGSGVGWVDAHLLASAMLARIPIWTLDRRLAVIARGLRILA